MYQINYEANTWLNLTGLNLLFMKDDIYLDKIYYYDPNTIEYIPVTIDIINNDSIYWIKTSKEGILRINDSNNQPEDKPPIINKNRNITKNHFYILAADKEDIPFLLNKLNGAKVIDYKQLPTNPNSLVSYLKKYK